MTKLSQTKSKEMTIADSLNFADTMISKGYLEELSQCKISEPLDDDDSLFEAIKMGRNARFWRLTKLVLHKKEQLSAQLTTIMNVANTVGGSVAALVKSENGSLDILVGVICKDHYMDKPLMQEKARSVLDAFDHALTGNLTGSEFVPLSQEERIALPRALESGAKAVCAISGIPAFRDEKQNELLYFAQGIEHLIDAMQGENFTVLSIADPVSHRKIEQTKEGYALIYSQLSSLLHTQLTLNESSSQSLSEAQTKSITDSITEGISLTQSRTNTNGKYAGMNAGVNFGVSFIASGGVQMGMSRGKNASISDSQGETKMFNEGKTFGNSETKSVGTTKSVGNSMQLTFANRSVQSLLEKIDKQIARLELCKSFGAFSGATYILSENRSTALAAASNLTALFCAEESYLEGSVVNTWHNAEEIKQLLNFLGGFTHPKFLYPPTLRNLSTEQLLLTPSSILTGKEATLLLGLPRQSVAGVPVVEMAPFGRNVLPVAKENALRLGALSHMGKEDGKSVFLDNQSLPSHTFITGSTGAGKSNVVYQILESLSEKHIPFLVIEPAKGEYPHIFGGRPDVSVLGTNPAKAAMLRINPFSFPKDIHILEHIDRLIEIFNVCWPMYAAMPAVLKDAVERAYQAAGWDLDTSENRFPSPIYPAFADVLSALYTVVNESDFSAELKSNYTGALVTRVKSLTNGINGQIFVPDEIDSRILFDRNVLVDLSRVASTETKAMIMGLLVMKLQEYRLSIGGMNKPLKHVTVLEEAHQLLKATSLEQSSESANLLGKSVEMLSQSIAEMRTYGEGFLIVDQSPTLLDRSVIRNTNTKILLRLPDLADRELCGRAAGLNPDQIIELAKLPTGVAAVYQNNWLEPILCKTPKFHSACQPFSYSGKAVRKSDDKLKETLIRCLLSKSVGEKVEYSVDDLKERVMRSGLLAPAKIAVLEALGKPEKGFADVSGAIAALFPVGNLLSLAPHASDIESWNRDLMRHLAFDNLHLEQAYRNVALQCVLREQCNEESALREVYGKWTAWMRGERL